jgi:penicillin-binding protein 2
MVRYSLVSGAHLELQRRLRFLHAATLVAFLLLFLRLWSLQILEGNRYEALAQTNCLRLYVEEGCRGVILDRNGEMLAGNRPSFDVFVNPREISDPKVTSFLLAPLLRMDATELLGRLEEGRRSASEPILVKRDVDQDTMVSLQERRHDLGGVTIRVRPLRFYPHRDFATHLLGYVSEVSPWQLSREENRDFRFGDRIGQGGVEGAYDALLRGVEGGEQVVVDALGRPRRELPRIEPKPGFTMVLTLDSRIQRLAEEAMRGRMGALVAMDPFTGEILALVSKPSYDPNLFISRLRPEQWRALVSNPYHPLQNRVLQAAYPPGSLFKLITAIAALRKGVITPDTTFRCQGSFSLGSYQYACWKKEGHGSVNLKQAIAQSCNVYFYNVALRVGIEELARTAREFGLGESLGLRLCQEAKGLVPTPDWKREAKGEKWYLGNTVQAGIGQGMITATPLQILQMISAIANGGKLFRPLVVKEVRSAEGELVERYVPEVIREIQIPSDVLAAVRKGMWAAVNDKGTGYQARIEGLAVCGKTATAQVVSRPKNGGGAGRLLSDHAWFACFAPEDHPRVAMVVLVEHGGYGGVAAAQVARQVLEGIFSPELRPEGQAKVASTSSLPSSEGRLVR